MLACELHDVAKYQQTFASGSNFVKFIFIETLLLQCSEYDKIGDQIQTFNINNQNTIKAILHSFCDQKINKGK